MVKFFGGCSPVFYSFKTFFENAALPQTTIKGRFMLMKNEIKQPEPDKTEFKTAPAEAETENEAAKTVKPAEPDGKNNRSPKLNAAKKCALSAMFAALAYGVSLLEIPIFPAVRFLKLDLSFAVLMLGGYVLGPVYGELVIAVAVSLGLFKTTSAGVGELANFITANVFIMPPVIFYKFKKGLKTVVISMAVSSVLTVAAALLVNRFMLFPMYMGDGAKAVFEANVYFILAFNAIKCVINAAITLVLYKKLKKLLNKFFE